MEANYPSNSARDYTPDNEESVWVFHEGRPPEASTRYARIAGTRTADDNGGWFYHPADDNTGSDHAPDAMTARYARMARDEHHSSACHRDACEALRVLARGPVPVTPGLSPEMARAERKGALDAMREYARAHHVPWDEPILYGRTGAQGDADWVS